jgi:hypothetical protein
MFEYWQLGLSMIFGQIVPFFYYKLADLVPVLLGRSAQ